MDSGGIKNLAEYIKSKSKDYLFSIWYYILLYVTQYPAGQIGNRILF